MYHLLRKLSENSKIFSSCFSNIYMEYEEIDSESSDDMEKVEQFHPDCVKLEIKEEQVIDTGVNYSKNKEYATSRPAISYTSCHMDDLYLLSSVELKMTREISFDTLEEQEEEFIKRYECGVMKEDAFFIVQTEKYLVFGVANVVGDSPDHGIFNEVFSDQFVKHASERAKKIIENLESKFTYNFRPSDDNVELNLNPLALLKASFNDLVKDGCRMVCSSSNAIFGVHYHKNNKLDVAKFGYSGIYVHTTSDFKFNTPVKKSNEIEVIESTRPSLKKLKIDNHLTNILEVECYSFILSEGDYAMVATEAVWENFEIRKFEESSFFKKSLLNYFKRYPRMQRLSKKERFIRYNYKAFMGIYFLELFYLYVYHGKSSHWYKRRVLRRTMPLNDVGKEQFILLTITI